MQSSRRIRSKWMTGHRNAHTAVSDVNVPVKAINIMDKGDKAIPDTSHI